MNLFHAYDAASNVTSIIETGDITAGADTRGEVEYTLYSRAGVLLYSYKPGTGESTDFVYLGSMPLVELKTVPGQVQNPVAENPPLPSQVALLPGLPPQLTSGGPSNAQIVTTYLHANLLGSPIQWSGRSGTWMAVEHYEAYGHKLNGVADKLGYTGHAHDFETDLTYMQARFYDAQVGRFLSSDPVEFGGGGDTFFMNRFAYANNNPYRYVDPTGMMVDKGSIEDKCSEVCLDVVGGSGDKSPVVQGSAGRAPQASADGVTVTGNYAAGTLGQYGTYPSSLHLELRVGEATLEGQPGNYTLLGGLHLVSQFNSPDASPIFGFSIPTPTPLSDQGFANQLITAAQAYGNGLPYNMPILGFGYMLPGTYNSNSYVSGVLQAGSGRYMGGVLDAVRSQGFLAPGYTHPIPIP